MHIIIWYQYELCYYKNKHHYFYLFWWNGARQSTSHITSHITQKTNTQNQNRRPATSIMESHQSNIPLDSKSIVGPVVNWTVADVFKSDPRKFMTYHVMSAGYDLFTPVGAAVGGVLHFIRWRPFPSVLAMMGTTGLVGGGLGKLYRRFYCICKWCNNFKLIACLLRLFHPFLKHLFSIRRNNGRTIRNAKESKYGRCSIASMERQRNSRKGRWYI